MNKDTSKIPKGIYCYDENGKCPYWSIREDREEQENGYCKFLEMGDGENGIFLLWDQVKECTENLDDEDTYDII